MLVLQGSTDSATLTLFSFSAKNWAENHQKLGYPLFGCMATLNTHNRKTHQPMAKHKKEQCKIKSTFESL